MAPGGRDGFEVLRDRFGISNTYNNGNPGVTQRDSHTLLPDTGERMIPAGEDEVSIVFARHRFAYQFAGPFVSGKEVLDIGCGTGYGCGLISQSAKRVVGIDQNADAIAYCRLHYPAANIEYRQADGAVLDDAEMFDVAISFQVIEHLADPGGFLDRVRMVVRPGGTILIATPNSRTGARGVSDNPFHVSEMNHAEFSDLIGHTFRESEILGIGYATKSRLRGILVKSPLYSIGKLLKRKSKLKKLAAATMQMTRFQILHKNIPEEAIDLLAVCKNV